MITCCFGRTIDDWCALFEDVLVGEGFEDNLVADAVDVALCYTDFEFSFHDKKYVFFVIFAMFECDCFLRHTLLEGCLRVG